MGIDQIMIGINKSLDKLYAIDQFLIDNDLCERSINHRFAMYLQEQFSEYFVDCEYNRSHIGDENDQKRIIDEGNGNYVDIIVGLRSRRPEDDFICFETKKWNNLSDRGRNNDQLKLQTLTSGYQFDYKFGFHIIFGASRANTLIHTYKEGLLVD